MTKYDMSAPGMNLLLANLIWDLVPHAEAGDMMAELGLTPPGPDGQEMECRGSHIRLALVDPMDAQLDFFAAKISEIAIRVILGDAAQEIDAQIMSGLVTQYEAIIAAALKVTLANLLAAELLEYV